MRILSLFVVSFFLISEAVCQLTHEQLTQSLKWRNIGPANQGGRIVDVEARPGNFKEVYIGVASGGVWKSNNAGTTWKSIFDDYETASIGDIALDPNQKETIWVGTGEANNRNSVSWGNGIYKSLNGGKSFVNMGLESTHQIARVKVHPQDSDNVCVCAVGHLWGYKGERGLFQTKDGGKSWNKLTNGLPNDGKTGCTDLVQDATNPEILYTAFYHRLRQPWHFHSGGEASGIYKSVDGGKSWNKLSQGLPQGETGRIGLAIYNKDPNILMAIVEAEKTDTLGIPGTGVYRSEDGGNTWTYTNTYNNRPFYYSQIRINPQDDQKVYVLTTKFMVSEDGGKTLHDGSKDREVHGDFHALWIDPNDSDRYYLGADKGFSITHDHGKHFTLIDNLPIAQYYRIHYDMRDPYYIYGGLQDNGSYATASFSRDARGILNDSNWKMHWGDGQDVASNPDDWTDMYSSMENGSYIKYNPLTRDIKNISPNSLNTSNFSDYFDLNKEHLLSDIRWNWSAPLLMSPHDYNSIYVAGNHVFKSTDKGNSWKVISPDLSKNDKRKRQYGLSGGVTPDNTGAESHCSVSAMSISPIKKGMIWVGTDDGNVQLSENDGKSWKNVTENVIGVPDSMWVSRVESSHHKYSRAYISYDGHRSDNNEPLVFVTDNCGKKWKKITNGFGPNDNVRVIREDHNNPNLLFAGTETGVWYTIDRGENWQRLKLNMPTVSVYDIKIHPRENDLIVGTHGRSAWILDDISVLQQVNIEYKKPFRLIKHKPATLWKNTSRGGQRGHFIYAGQNPPTINTNTSKPRAGFENHVAISYIINEEQNDSLLLKIESNSCNTEFMISGSKGIHRVYWDRHCEAISFSENEINQIKRTVHELAKQIDNSRLRRTDAELTNAKTSDEVKNIIKPLTGGYLNLGIDETLHFPKAGVGNYKVSISNGEQSSSEVVIIREDPLTKQW